MIAALVAMSAALRHGYALGTYGNLAHLGLTQRADVVAHNSLATDQITQMIPWTSLAWTQVHHGLLPLWNPFSALGTPLAFNWQSAPFGLPALVGYAVPLGFAYSAGVLTTLIVAGTGVYLLGRSLGLSIMASALAGTAFELCGAFFGWLGWPVSSVLSWSGWLLAASLLVIRGQRRVRLVVCFALFVAAACYAGQPDTLILLMVLLGLFVVATLAQGFVQSRESRTVIRPVIDLLLGGLAGAALAAPLLLPGFQLLARSVRNGGGSALGSQQAHSLRDFVDVFLGFDGLLSTTEWSIGAIVVVLAVTGVAMRWRRPGVLPLVVTGLGLALVSFVEPVIRLLNAVPGLHAVRWPRAIVGVVLVVVLLAGVGLDVIVRGDNMSVVRRWFAGSAVAVAVGFVLAVTVGTSGAPAISPFYAGDLEQLKHRSIWWGAVGVAAVLIVAVVLFASGRRARQPSTERPTRTRRHMLVALSLLTVETVSLVAMALPLWASTANPSSGGKQAVALRRAVSGGLVGLGPAAQFCTAVPGIGLLPNTNILWGVHQFAVYDPMLPSTYFSSWLTETGNYGGTTFASTFCPAVTSAKAARQYGVEYVLEEHGATGPTGAVFDRSIGDEDLYRIPGSGQATLTSLGPDERIPSDAAPGVPVAVRHPKPSIWSIRTSSPTAQVLRLHLTDVPGWHATVDGAPLALHPYAGLMLQARIPAGAHNIEVTYWPSTFTVGLGMAAISTLCIIVAIVVSLTRRRRLRHSAR